MIGIYKITSPSKRVYIGQSINIENRFVNYKYTGCKKQHKLYKSFIKYGVKNHIFEVLAECEITELNELERYYQDLFDATGKMGMNCKLTKSNDRNGKLSDETKLKISSSNMGRDSGMLNKTHSVETKKKMSAKLIGNKRGCNKKMSEQQKEKLRRLYSKLILDTETGIFYLGTKEAAQYKCINPSTLKNRLNGNLKNNTTLIYC